MTVRVPLAAERAQVDSLDAGELSAGERAGVASTILLACWLTNAATDSRSADVALRFAQCSYLARLQLS
jgi:hypothetical protein